MAILKLNGFGVAFGNQQVLRHIDLLVPERGTTVLFGPAGTGKTTLLRTLAGYNDTQPSFRCYGTAWYAGAPLGHGERPVLVAQNARLLVSSVFQNLVMNLPGRAELTQAQQREQIDRLLVRCGLNEVRERLHEEVIELPLGLQRRLAIVRAVAVDPPLLMLDEPTAGLPEDEVGPLLELIRQEATRRAVLMVTHHQEHGRAVATNVALLVAGQVREQAPAEQFFTRPRTHYARQFLRTGSCPDELEPISLDGYNDIIGESPSEPAREMVVEIDRERANGLSRSCEMLFASESRPVGSGPRGFRWLKPGLLGGTPRPGIIDDVRHDLELLRAIGIRVLVTLEEEPFDRHLLAEFGIEPVHLPIPDMAAPTVEETAALCRRLTEYLRQGTPVAVHCRAGLGRTGTILACQLIWEGWSAVEALEYVRRIEPRWVQSDEQIRHLTRFASALAREE